MKHLFSCHWGVGFFWIRFGRTGPGFIVTDKIKHPPMFSERYGHEKWFRVGRYGMRFLEEVK